MNRGDITKFPLTSPLFIRETTKHRRRIVALLVSWPCQWKLSNVTPVHKKDDETSKKNCRPISVLSVIPNVLKSLLIGPAMTGTAIFQHLG